MSKIKSSITKPLSLTGYKGFNLNRNGKAFCNPTGGKGKIYSLGKNVDKHSPKICSRGIHFCVKPEAVLNYYSITNPFHMNQNVFAKLTVPTNQDISSSDNKKAAQTIFIEKFYTADEYIKEFGKRIGRYDNWPSSLTSLRNDLFSDQRTFSIVLYVKRDSYGYFRIQGIDERTADVVPKSLTDNIVGVSLRKTGVYTLKGSLYKFGSRRYMVVSSINEHQVQTNSISSHKQKIV